MKQPTFSEFGILGSIVGLKRTEHVREERWYCEGSGKSAGSLDWRSAIACPECGRIVRVTSLRKIPNHNRAEAIAS